MLHIHCVEGWLCGKYVRNIWHPSHWIIRDLYLFCDTIEIRQTVSSDWMKHGYNHQPTTLPTIKLLTEESVTNWLTVLRSSLINHRLAKQPCRPVYYLVNFTVSKINGWLSIITWQLGCHPGSTADRGRPDRTTVWRSGSPGARWQEPTGRLGPQSRPTKPRKRPRRSKGKIPRKPWRWSPGSQYPSWLPSAAWCSCWTGTVTEPDNRLSFASARL